MSVKGSISLGGTARTAVCALLLVLATIGASFRILPSSRRTVHLNYHTRETHPTHYTHPLQPLRNNRNNIALHDTENEDSPTITDIKTPPSSLKELLRKPLYTPPTKRSGIVIIAGFESFNILLYRRAAAKIK